MGRRLNGWAVALTAAALTLGAGVAAADNEVEQKEARQLVRAGKILPLERILATAFAQQNGRVLEVELERKDNRYVYEVELVTEAGEVWEIKVDATTAELVKAKRED